MFSKTRLLHLLLLLSTGSFAQSFEPSSGLAIIFFEADTKIIVKLDSTTIEQTKDPILLKEGKYVVKAWAPHKKLFVDTIIVKENKTSICVNHLRSTDEYIHYKNQLRSYKLKKCALFAPLPLVAVFSGVTLSRINTNKKEMERYTERAAVATAGYNSAVAVTNINVFKQEYELSRSQYNKRLHENNRLRTTACIVVPVGIVASAALFIITRKLVKPVYAETPLLSLNTIGIRKDYSSGYALSVGLTINR